jgi:hypothetical protein
VPKSCLNDTYYTSKIVIKSGKVLPQNLHKRAKKLNVKIT